MGYLHSRVIKAGLIPDRVIGYKRVGIYLT